MPRNNLKAVLFMLLCIFSTHAIGQEMGADDTSQIREEINWENLLEPAENDEDNSAMLEDLEARGREPLDINTAPPEKIGQVPLITNLMASRIVERRMNSPITDMNELKEIEGVTPAIFLSMKKYFKIGGGTVKAPVNADYTGRMKRGIEEQRGFTNGTYIGTPEKMLNRFRISFGAADAPMSPSVKEIRAGIIMEKDPGERGITDFLSGYAALSLAPLSAYLILGDFQVSCAEGLVLGNAYAMPKGNDVIRQARTNDGGIRISSSSDENLFYRGAALKIGGGGMSFQLFYSDKPVNASLDSMGRITSMDRSGLFRTRSEIRRRNTSREIIFGDRLSISLPDGFRVGHTGYYAEFANPRMLEKEGKECSSNYSLQGFDISYTNRYVDLFTENAFDRSGNTAVLLGCVYNPIQKLAVAVNLRKYPALFKSIHGNVMGEVDGDIRNQLGVYTGVCFKPVKGMNVSSYYDQYSSLTHINSPDAFSQGNEFLILSEWSVTGNLQLYFRFKKKEKRSAEEVSDEYGRSVQKGVSEIQNNYRLGSNFRSSQHLRLANRIEWVEFDPGGTRGVEKGVLISQSARWEYSHALTFRIRVTLFETDSYNSRLYEIEEDLPYVFACPPLYDKGIRFYIVINYKCLSNIVLSAKYWQMYKEGAIFLGSGNDRIEGNKQSYFSLQIDAEL